MKTVAVIGTVGLPACYGGFETLVENLTRLSSKNFKYYVFCSGTSYEDKIKTYNNAHLIYLPMKANGLQSIFYDILSMIKCWKLKPDIILVLGVSGCIFLPIFKLFSKSRIIVNVDGLEWRREKWGGLTKRFLKFSERMSILFSDKVISDNEAITSYLKEEYSIKSETIAYGGDHIFPEGAYVKNVLKDDYYFSVCRIEPENNVHIILDAFSRSNKKLVFVGNWDKSSYGLELKRKYGVFSNIMLHDPIYDKCKLFSIREKSIGYIHGHSAGGTNPSLVEAMNSNSAIFAFDCIFNQYTMDNQGCFFKSAEELQLLIDKQTPKSLSENAASLLCVANRKYKWLNIVRQYENLYH